jgi:hypothetical protein
MARPLIPRLAALPALPALHASPASPAYVTALLLALAFLPGAELAAQQPLLTKDGDTDDDLFGYSVADAGDVNADGFDDVIVGARGNDVPGILNAGSAFVYSGKDGSQLHAFHGDNQSDVFGYAVAGVGDLNLDGYDDIAVGATQDEFLFGVNTGSVRIYSGQTGLQLFSIFGLQNDSLCGASIDGCGDWNGDGRPDIAIGAPNHDVTIFTTVLENAGLVRVVSGVNGATIVNFNGIAAHQTFGWSVAGAGDVDDDGVQDLVVGSPGASSTFSGSGRVQVYSGALKSVLFSVNGGAASQNLGIGVGRAGDVNGDGFDDIVAGAYGTLGNAGSVRIFRGPTGTAGWTLYGSAVDDRLGYDVDGVGDVDKDGRADFMGGAYQGAGGKKGYVRVWSGATGALIVQINGQAADDSFGRTCAGAGDVNGDGWPDIVVGAPSHDAGGDDAGRARVFDILTHQKNIGYQGPGSATLAMYGTPLGTGGVADIVLTGAAAKKAATLVASVGFGPAPFKGGTLAPHLTFAAFFNFTTSLTGTVSLPGVTGGGGPFFIYMQFVIKDPAQPQGFALSNCVQAAFLP